MATFAPLVAVLLVSSVGGGLAADVHVTMFGLGAMGCAGAEQLSKQPGVKLTVWNRSPGKCTEELASANVVRATSGKEALAQAEVAIFTLTAMEHVLAIFDDAAAVEAAKKSGTTIVSFATASIDAARKQEKALTAKLGADSVINGAMMCAPTGFAGAQCPMWLGGSEAAFTKANKVLALLGPAERVHDEAAGAAAYDTALVATWQRLVEGWLMSAAMVERAGFDAREAVRRTSAILPMILPTTENILKTSLDGKYEDYERFGKTEVNIDINNVFVEHSLEACKSGGMPFCDQFEAAGKFYKPLVDAGFKHLSHGAVYEYLMDPSLARLKAKAAAFKDKKKTEL